MELEPRSVCDDRYRRLTLVHAPIHASWLTRSRFTLDFQRKVLVPNDITELNALAERLLDFQYYWETTARRFQWKFTRQNLGLLYTTLIRLHGFVIDVLKIRTVEQAPGALLLAD